MYIQDLCNQYFKEAMIEYSELEDLRNEDLKIIDSDKVVEGHTINVSIFSGSFQSKLHLVVHLMKF